MNTSAPRILRLICMLALAFPFPILMSQEKTADPEKTVVSPGIDVLRARGFDILRGKRVGLVTNPTGVTAAMTSTADVLFTDPAVNLVALFGPEHGIRGDAEAGAYVASYVDQKTGITVRSLYGPTRKPTPEMLSGIDVLVYDIQDIGVRSYTYISTMGLVMEAGAELGIPVVVLDRPDPLNGNQVSGPILETEFKSFVGAYPIPYVYGLTAGELAQMINGERWLEGGKRCSLTVIPMVGWKRSMWFDDTGLQWVPTSPHIPHSQTTIFYVLTGLLGELGTANQGVGYTLPFELVGAPWADGERLASYLNSRGLTGVFFRPLFYKPFYFNGEGTKYGGVQIHITDRDALDLTRIQIQILEALIHLFPDWHIIDRSPENKLAMFDKVVGTTRVRQWLTAGLSVDEIVDRLNQGLAKYMIKRQRYLLYE